MLRIFMKILPFQEFFENCLELFAKIWSNIEKNYECSSGVKPTDASEFIKEAYEKSIETGSFGMFHKL